MAVMDGCSFFITFSGSKCSEEKPATHVKYTLFYLLMFWGSFTDVTPNGLPSRCDLARAGWHQTIIITSSCWGHVRSRNLALIWINLTQSKSMLFPLCQINFPQVLINSPKFLLVWIWKPFQFLWWVSHILLVITVSSPPHLHSYF